MRLVAIAERGPSLNLGQLHSGPPQGGHHHHQVAAILAAFANNLMTNGLPYSLPGTLSDAFNTNLPIILPTWRLQLLWQNVHWVQFGLWELTAREAHVADICQVKGRLRGCRLTTIEEAATGAAWRRACPDSIAEAAGGGITGRTATHWEGQG